MSLPASRIAASDMSLPVRLVVARHSRSTGRNELKSREEIMEILEAFDLTGSFRAAAELAGCSHHTVEHYVTMRNQGRLPDGNDPVERDKLIDPFLPKRRSGWSGPTARSAVTSPSPSWSRSGSPARTAPCAERWPA